MRDALLEIRGLDFSVGENSQSGKLGCREILRRNGRERSLSRDLIEIDP